MKYVLILSSFIFSYPICAQNNIGMVTPANFQNPVGDTLRVVSWNVEHFVDAFDNPYIRANREDSADANQVKKRCKALAGVLKKLDADVVVLQEFESQIFLQQIVRQYLPNSGYRFFAASPSPSWYMNVVVMSRVPLGTIHGYGSATTPVVGMVDTTGLPESQHRINTRMLSVEVFPKEDYGFVLTGLHLKAGRGERNEAMREGQIRFLLAQCRRFQREKRRSHQIILGDFNCLPDSREFALLTSKYRNLQFENIWATGTKTHPADAPSRQLDYIIVNKQMQKKLIDNSAKVATILSPEKMREISDHLPVMADFVLK